MESITVKLPDTTIGSLEAIADEEYGGNRSDAIRAMIAKGMDYDDIETRHDDLQRQLAAVNARQEDVTELVEYVDQQREAERYRDRRRRMVDQAGVVTRAKWWLTGVPVDGDP